MFKVSKFLKNYYKKNFQPQKKNFFVKTYNNENLTKFELKLIAGNRGIKKLSNMSREKLLSTLDESMRLKQIAKMQNFHKMNLSKSQK